MKNGSFSLTLDWVLRFYTHALLRRLQLDGPSEYNGDDCHESDDGYSKY